MKTPRLILTLAALQFALGAACHAALKKGGAAYTKRMETALLAEPKPFAATVANIEFAESLSIDEVRGSWLRVTHKKLKKTGWVYAGNVADDEPVIPPAEGMTAGQASETSTATAARPLTRAAREYAESQGQPPQLQDWLAQAAAAVTDDDITRYLSENKKGEYQQ